MSTKHYRDDSGNYIGGFGDGARPPAGAIETPAPVDGRMKWIGDKWTKTREITDMEDELLSIRNDYESLPDGPMKRLMRVAIKDIVTDV